MPTEPTATFETTLTATGGTTTGIVVPDDAIDALGAGRKPAVVVTVNGYSYRSTVAVMGGRFMVGVSAEHRKGAGVAAGDAIDVRLVLDTAPREIVVPDDLAAALNASPSAKAAFDALSYSRKRGFVEPVEAAKTPETRARRIAKVVADLG